VGFSLAANFLYSIVISVDFMTFKRETFGVVCCPAGRLSRCRLPSLIRGGIDKHLCRFGRVTCNSLKSSTLGV
jgi:hypothetical protein